MLNVVAVGTDFGSSDLQRVDATGANMVSAHIGGDASNATFVDVDLSSSTLSGGFNFADLTGAILQNSVLGGTSIFNDAVMRDVDLTGASIEGGANFRRADLRGSDFGGASVVFSFFQDADLRGADFSTATFLFGPVFTGALYDGATLFPTGFDPVVNGLVFVPEPNTAVLLLLGFGILGSGRKPSRRPRAPRCA